VYHRILKIVVGPARKDDVPTLQTDALGRFGSWNSIKLHKVHSQVNDLKHEPQGIYSGRLVTYEEALTATDELLNLIEAWASANISTVPKP